MALMRTLGKFATTAALAAGLALAGCGASDEPETGLVGSLETVRPDAEDAGEDRQRRRGRHRRLARPTPALATGSEEDSSLFRCHILPLLDGSPLPGEGELLEPPQLVGARPQKIHADRRQERDPDRVDRDEADP